MNLSLPPSLRKWVDSQVETGGYGTASEFVRDMLRQARMRQLRSQIDPLLLQAVRSGATIEMDDDDWSEIRSAAKKQARRASRGKRA
jgi:antitoxin ParD1/3/4